MNNYRTIQQKDMHKLFPAWEHNIPTLGTKCSHTGNKTALRFALSLLLMFLLGFNTAWGKDPVEITKDTDGNGIIDDNEKKFYLIQSYLNTAFYMRPNNTNNTNVTTLNTLTDNMKWFFLDAGTGTEGSDEVQYFYICDKDGRYMYFSSPNYVGTGGNQRIWITLLNSITSGSEDNYKFYIAKKNTKSWDAYNIIPKGTNNSSSLNKQGGNAGTGNVQVGSGFDDAGSCWNLIALADYNWTLHSDCFTVSDTNNRYFYKIKSQNNASYYIKPGTNYVETSNENDDDMIWYFEEAASDALMTYYYIRHTNTGQYLRYRSDGVGQDNAIELVTHTGSETGNDEARFQFIVARGANANETVTDPKGIIFNIIPKLLNNNANINSVSCDKGQGQPLKTKADRNVNQTHWSFESVEYSTDCTAPTITFSNATGKATISTTTTRSSIYYTTDGTEPSSTSTLYSGPFDVTEETIIKAIVTRDGFTPSDITTTTIYKVATPTIQNNGSNAVSITSETEDATIYYTIDGTDPNTSSTVYSSPLSENISGVTIRAIAVKDGMINSAISSGSVTLSCATPVFTKNGNNLTISCSFPTGAGIYYTTNGEDPTSSSTPYSSPISVGPGDVIKAIAIASGYNKSDVITKKIYDDLTPTDGKYLINSQTDFVKFVDMVSTTEGATYHYILKTNVDAGSPITEPFTGVFEVAADENGSFYTISGLTHPLFNTINGGTVKNVILDNVNIPSGGTNVGAICGEATGASRIYNCGVLATGSTVTKDKDGYDVITSCGSTINGSGYVGGIVGLLDGSSRVINCFSYATVQGGSYVGGIVGYNNVATNALTADNIKTMVMNCMFYGDITGGSDKAPIYNGQNIANKVVVNNDVKTAQGVSNFNYFWEGASYVKSINTYNCALSAETRYLQRFEFFRHLLNSNRELAAWWVDGQKGDMAKWVLDKSVAPFPILKKQGYYPSVVNHIAAKMSSTDNTSVIDYTASTAPETPETQKTLLVTLSGTGITTTSLTLPITDKDPDNFNFNYHKVQLPYYNDVGTENYKNGLVVTGWEVTVSGGTHSYSTGADGSATVNNETGEITLTTPYNFADRKSTGKDNYGTSGRIFSQGAYFDVPEGVSSISIEPYWGKAVFIADASLDVVYNQNMDNAYNVPSVGSGVRYTNGQSYTFTTKDGDITLPVYTKFGGNDGALKALFPSDPTGTVYDNALVLVGNFHSLALSSEAKNLPYTIMSADFDHDNEPDNSYILRFNDRKRLHPVRLDFLDVIGLGMAQKSVEAKGTYNLGIMQPYGWFECTNTGLFRVTQFEYDCGGTNGKDLRANSPMILQGGVIEQWVTVGGNAETMLEGKSVTYYHVGGNVWFKEFHIGVHQDKTQDKFVSPHPPISVTGGDFDEFYLTGLYNTPNNNYDDNAECYINGGRFGKVAGTGMQGIGVAGKNPSTNDTGNIIWQIDNADIDEFYAGGINAAHIATGNITTVISNSRVDQFCGGPKFGNMNSDKIVATNATNCTFRTFFGAGYGGNSYNRRYPTNKYNAYNYNWNSWLIGEASYDYSYSAPNEFNGVETRIDYQFIPKSDNEQNVGRLFIDYVSFSLATTHDVTSKLTDCTITTSPLGRLAISDDYKCLGSFYGGGSLGMVDGPVKSTLTNCIVEGNVFGGGYSATLPTVAVMNNSFQTEPRYDENLGAYMDAELPTTVAYTWQHRDVVDSKETAIDMGSHILYTTENLTGLGAVTGDVTLTINGNSNIGHDVFGGGDSSAVINTTNPANASTTVKLQGNAQVQGNVFGGGNRGLVSGTATVNVEQ